MPGQMTEEFARRRRQLMRLMGRDAIAVLSAAPERTRNSDVYYNYRQDSDFHYLTGFAEPDSVAVLIPAGREGEFVMFVRDRDQRARDLGRPARGAGGRAGATTAPTMPSRSAISTTSCPDCSRAGACYHTMGRYHDFDQRVVGWVNALRAQARSGAHPPLEFVALITCCTTCGLSRAARNSRIMRRVGRDRRRRTRARHALLPSGPHRI